MVIYKDKKEEKNENRFPPLFLFVNTDDQLRLIVRQICVSR